VYRCKYGAVCVRVCVWHRVAVVVAAVIHGKEFVVSLKYFHIIYELSLFYLRIIYSDFT